MQKKERKKKRKKKYISGNDRFYKICWKIISLCNMKIFRFTLTNKIILKNTVLTKNIFYSKFN